MQASDSHCESHSAPFSHEVTRKQKLANKSESWMVISTNNQDLTGYPSSFLGTLTLTRKLLGRQKLLWARSRVDQHKSTIQRSELSYQLGQENHTKNMGLIQSTLGF